MMIIKAFNVSDNDITNLSGVIYHVCKEWKKIIDHNKNIATTGETELIYRAYYTALQIAIGRYSMITGHQIDWSWEKRDEIAKGIQFLPFPVSFEKIKEITKNILK